MCDITLNSVDTQNKNVAAFIDLDGTLCDKFLWQALIAHHKHKRFKRTTLYAYIAFHYPLYILSKAGILSSSYFYRLNATNLAVLVGGIALDRAERIWAWILDHEIIPHLRPEMLAALKDHKKRGHRVILNSGSFSPLLDMLSSHLGAEGALATPLAVKNGRYTGKIIPPLNVGRGKVERLAQFLEGPGQQIDLSASYFYTDSIVDAPAMEMFGHPVAVYPDPELMALAGKRHWRIIPEQTLNE